MCNVFNKYFPCYHFLALIMAVLFCSSCEKTKTSQEQVDSLSCCDSMPSRFNLHDR